MNENPINDLVVKLSGKAEIPEPLVLGNSYNLVIDGAVTTITESDNHDGTKTIYYKFEPLIVTIVKDNGEMIKARDVRSRSQQLRSALWKKWRENEVDMEFEAYYDAWMLRIIKETIERPWPPQN